MDETKDVIEIPQAAYDAGATALADYVLPGLDPSEVPEAAGAVLEAGVPAALVAAYTELADRLTDLAESMDHYRNQAGLVEGIAVIRERAARLRGDHR